MQDRRTPGAAILLALAALDYAAFDDITTGVEPNFTAEWITLGLSLPIAWLAVRWMRQSPDAEGLTVQLTRNLVRR